MDETNLMVIGWITAFCGAWFLILLLIIGLAYLTNFAIHKALDSYGGWKTFNKFTKWYWEQPENSKNASESHGGQIDIDTKSQNLNYSNGACADQLDQSDKSELSDKKYPWGYIGRGITKI